MNVFENGCLEIFFLVKSIISFIFDAILNLTFWKIHFYNLFSHLINHFNILTIFVNKANEKCNMITRRRNVYIHELKKKKKNYLFWNKIHWSVNFISKLITNEKFSLVSDNKSLCILTDGHYFSHILFISLHYNLMYAEND